MPCFFHRTLCVWCLGIGVLSVVPLSICAQQPVPLTSILARTEGTDPANTRLYLTAATTPAPKDFDITLPTLTVQCTYHVDGKYSFELLVNFGGVTDTAYYAPWRPRKNYPFDHPPPTVDLTMEFLGYTHVKPVKRQFQMVEAPVGQLRYNSPGMHSHNLEEVAYHFQYLRALPTFRVSDSTHSVTFETAPLLEQIHKEPLCHASSL